MKSRVIGAIGFISIIMVGCAGSPKKSAMQAKCLPSWEENPIRKKEYIFGSGQSNMEAGRIDYQDAKDEADHIALEGIVKQLSMRIMVNIERSFTKLGFGGEIQKKAFQIASGAISREIDLQGATIEKREINCGRVFSLAKVPLSEKERSRIAGLITREIKSLTSEEGVENKAAHDEAMKEIEKKLYKSFE